MENLLSKWLENKFIVTEIDKIIDFVLSNIWKLKHWILVNVWDIYKYKALPISIFKEKDLLNINYKELMYDEDTIFQIIDYKEIEHNISFYTNDNLENKIDKIFDTQHIWLNAMWNRFEIKELLKINLINKISKEYNFIKIINKKYKINTEVLVLYFNES